MTYKNSDETDLEEEDDRALVLFTANEENDSQVNDDATLTSEKDSDDEADSKADLGSSEAHPNNKPIDCKPKTSFFFFFFSLATNLEL